MTVIEQLSSPLLKGIQTLAEIINDKLLLGEFQNKEKSKLKTIALYYYSDVRGRDVSYYDFFRTLHAMRDDELLTIIWEYPMCEDDFLSDNNAYAYENGGNEMSICEVELTKGYEKKIGKILTIVDGVKREAMAKKIFFNKEAQNATYRGVHIDIKHGTQGYVIMELLTESENFPYTIDDIMKYCNPKIRNQKHCFNTGRNIWFAINTLRRKFNVKASEDFPLKEIDKCYIYKEK